MAADHDQKGRTKDKGDHGTFVRRPMMERPAWRAMRPLRRAMPRANTSSWRQTPHTLHAACPTGCGAASVQLRACVQGAHLG